MISCGEASGDLYAGALAAELLRRDPSCRISGFGGERLRAAGAALTGDYRGFAVTGLTEAFVCCRARMACIAGWCRTRGRSAPTSSSQSTFPTSTSASAAAVHGLGIPVVYYVSPQLWAWRSGRIRAMKRFVAKVLPIFPFEVDLYEREGIPVEFVGHPLVDLIDVRTPRDEFLRGARPQSGGAHGRAAARKPPERAAGHRAGARRRDAADRGRVPDVQFVVARAPHLADALLDPLDTPVTTPARAARDRHRRGPHR